MLGQPESVSLSRHSLLHKLVVLSAVLLAFRLVMVVMIVMRVLPVRLEPRLSGIFNLNPRFSGQRLLSLIFACFFCLFLTFLLGLCISFLSTPRYRGFLLFLLLCGSAFEGSYRVASPLVLFVHFSGFLLRWHHFSVDSTVQTMVCFLFWGPPIEAFVAWLPSAGAHSLISFHLFFCFPLGLALLFCPQPARGGGFFLLSCGPGLIEH